MTKAFTFASALLILTSCGGAQRTSPVLPLPSLNGAQAVAIEVDSNCGYETEPQLNPTKGGKVLIPAVPSSGDFEGYAEYAPLSADLHAIGEFESCSYNSYDIPVPKGYTADWFGYWNVCNGMCAFSFENADLKAQLQSSTWVPKRNYFLYVYTTSGGVLMTSYPIGKVKKKKEVLKFASPFENGLTWPPNDSISLEIVHAT